MGVASAAIRLRATQANTLACFIETANALWQSIEDAGMQPVSQAQYLGQTGRLTSTTPGPGQTQLTALGTTTGIGVTYYNVYKHPNLDVYVKIMVNDAGLSTTGHRWAHIRSEFFIDLDGAGAHVATTAVLVEAVFVPYLSAVGINLASPGGLPETYRNLHVNVDANSFWFACNPFTVGQVGASVYGPFYYYSPGTCLLGAGLFAATDGSGAMLLTAPASVSNWQSGSNVGVFYSGMTNGSNATVNNNFQHTAQRYWSREPAAKAWSFRGGATAGFVLDSVQPSDADGLRVQQARVYIAGARREFNFGFIPVTAAAEEAVIAMNLAGDMVRNYKVVKGFGPSNPGIAGGTVTANYDDASNSCPIFPWSVA